MTRKLDWTDLISFASANGLYLVNRISALPLPWWFPSGRECTAAVIDLFGQAARSCRSSSVVIDSGSLLDGTLGRAFEDDFGCGELVVPREAVQDFTDGFLAEIVNL